MQYKVNWPTSAVNMFYSKTLRVTVEVIMRVNPFTGMTVYIKTYTEK